MSTVEAGLTRDEGAAIAALVADVPEPRAAAIDALRFLQARRGWIDDEALASLAAALRMSVAALDEVATFYNLIFQQPVGETVILLCDSVTCWMMGRDALQARIGTRLGIRPGETTADGKFTLLPIVCLGACDNAPALMMGGMLHGGVDAVRLDALLDDVGRGDG
jgi:NADH-quinone oxidoreductase subunit E